MKYLFEKEITATPSLCDPSGKLSIVSTFTLFQDIASEHAEQMGVGGAAMQKRGAFWLTHKTRIAFYQRPWLMQKSVATTWPAHPGRMRCDRFYSLTMDGKTLAEGRTEWAVLDINSGTLRGIDTIGYPGDGEYIEKTVCDAPYIRFADDFSDEDKAASFTVRPSDIDVGHHMNNVAYVRMLLDAFPTKKLSEYDITELEVFFKTPCFEGDILDVYLRPNDSGWNCAIKRCDGQTAFFACLTAKPRNK